MDTLALTVGVIWITEWGIAASHVHRNNKRWQIHLFDHIAAKSLARLVPKDAKPTAWAKFWSTLARQTDGHNIDKFHVASFASHFPVAIYLLWGAPWWAWAVAAIGAQIIWRLVIRSSGLGWKSVWGRFFRRFAKGDE